MAKLRRPTNNNPAVIDDGYGRVYTLRIILEDGTILHKIGMCETSRTTDRMMEILRSFFMVYRYVPHTEMRKNKKTLVPRMLEKHMHKLLQDYKYSFDKTFDGSSEFFIGLDEDVLLGYIKDFDDLEFLKTTKPMRKEDYYKLSEEYRKRLVNKEVNIGSDSLPF